MAAFPSFGFAARSVLSFLPLLSFPVQARRTTHDSRFLDRQIEKAEKTRRNAEPRKRKQRPASPKGTDCEISHEANDHQTNRSTNPCDRTSNRPNSPLFSIALTERGQNRPIFETIRTFRLPVCKDGEFLRRSAVAGFSSFVVFADKEAKGGLSCLGALAFPPKETSKASRGPLGFLFSLTLFLSSSSTC